MCSLHPPQNNTDVYVKIARGVSAMVVFIGLPVVCILTMANCMQLTNRTFMALSFCLFLAACCESFIFLLMKGASCHVNPDGLPSDVVLEECTLSTGSSLTFCAITLWLLAAVSTSLIACHPASKTG